MLAEIYGWFTEGLDTADLKEAKAHRDELSGRGNGDVFSNMLGGPFWAAVTAA